MNKKEKDEVIFMIGLILVIIGTFNGIVGAVDWLAWRQPKYTTMMLEGVICLIVGNPMIIIGLLMPNKK